MIDVKDLPSIELACRLSEETSFEACIYCMKIAKRSKDATWEQDATWETAVLAASAGYVAGVRHERKRQRQKRQLSKDELALVKTYRIADDSERRFLLNFAKVMLEYAEKSAQIKHLLKKIKKEPADAATRQQACTE